MSEEIIYPEHDPFCIIYKLGPLHCNCVEDDDEYGLVGDEFDDS